MKEATFTYNPVQNEAMSTLQKIFIKISKLIKFFQENA